MYEMKRLLLFISTYEQVSSSRKRPMELNINDAVNKLLFPKCLSWSSRLNLKALQPRRCSISWSIIVSRIWLPSCQLSSSPIMLIWFNLLVVALGTLFVFTMIHAKGKGFVFLFVFWLINSFLRGYRHGCRRHHRRLLLPLLSNKTKGKPPKKRKITNQV